MSRKSITYKKAGVDIKRADQLAVSAKRMAHSTDRSGVLRGIGGFGGCFKLDKARYREPILVSSSDGVGTKLKLAIVMNKHDTVGIDLVAMNVNDILCVGAEPLFFLDYLGCSRLEPKTFKAILRGVVTGCRQAGCALIGGETAEMPDMYRRGEYDLAGFSLGVVERSEIIDGSRIRVGDTVIGLASSGPHSNGFSLIRNVLSKAQLRRYAPQLLKPTRIYVKTLLSLLRSTLRHDIHGIAHITGGAFYEKIKRILPGGCAIEIRNGMWKIPEIFSVIQRAGYITQHEMYHTFNMGIGLVCIVHPRSAEQIRRECRKRGVAAWTIGIVNKGNRKVTIR